MSELCSCCGCDWAGPRAACTAGSRQQAGTSHAGQLPACVRAGHGSVSGTHTTATNSTGHSLYRPCGDHQCVQASPGCRPATDAEWNASNPAQTDNTPDCELNAVTAPGLFMGFPFCHSVPQNGNPYTQPYLRPPGASAAADPDFNAGESVMKCTGERSLNGRRMDTAHALHFAATMGVSGRQGVLVQLLHCSSVCVLPAAVLGPPGPSMPQGPTCSSELQCRPWARTPLHSAWCVGVGGGRVAQVNTAWAGLGCVHVVLQVPWHNHDVCAYLCAAAPPP